jgi:hypothetical protein
VAYYYFECFEPRPGCGPEEVRQVVGRSADTWAKNNPRDDRILIAGKVLGLGHGFPQYMSIWRIENFSHLDRWLKRFAEDDVVKSPELAAWGSAAVERPAAIYADMGDELPMFTVR